MPKHIRHANPVGCEVRQDRALLVKGLPNDSAVHLLSQTKENGAAS